MQEISVTDEIMDLIRDEKYEDVFRISQMLDTPIARNHFFLLSRQGLKDKWIKRGITSNLAGILVDNEIFNIIELQKHYLDDSLNIKKPYHLKQIRRLLRKYDILPDKDTRHDRLCKLEGEWKYCPKCGLDITNHSIHGGELGSRLSGDHAY